MLARRGPRRRAVHAAAVLLLAGCAQILGLPADEELETIATAFCRCADFEDAWPGEGCKAHVEGRLAAASDSVRRSWLELFDDQSCRQCENLAGRATCAGTAPICVNTGGACGANEACCLADGESVYCGAQGVCVKEPQGCLESNQPCTPGVDVCCGEVGQLASCTGPAGGITRCVERCDPTGADNCDGCCVGVSFVSDLAPPESYSLCLNPENDCTKFCNLATESTCAADRACVPSAARFNDTQEKAWIDTCLPRCEVAGAQCEGGCCGRYANAEGEASLACVPYMITTPLFCARHCDATNGPTCGCPSGNCLCTPTPLFEGDPFGFTLDRCMPQPD
jgi:hypothetical protein